MLHKIVNLEKKSKKLLTSSHFAAQIHIWFSVHSRSSLRLGEKSERSDEANDCIFDLKSVFGILVSGFG